jgi:Domain of unknown function (DUF5753)
VVHGLLHTADYARAGHRGARPLLSPDQIELQYSASADRYQLIFRELEAIALSPQGSLDLIRKFKRDYEAA